MGRAGLSRDERDGTSGSAYNHPTMRLTFLFPHLILGGGETAMMPVAAGLSRFFEVTVAVRVKDRDAGGLSLEDELLERFPDTVFLDDEAAMVEHLRTTDLLLWYGSNATTPNALERLRHEPGGRPVAVRVVHTEKVEEGEAYFRRWHPLIDGACCVSPRVARRIPGAVFIPNTCDLRRLEGERQTFFNNGRPTLGSLGRLFRFKNVHWLIEHLEALDCNLLLQAMDSTDLGRADLEALARDTHKFESRYLDRLVGPYPQAAELYRQRSPVRHADRSASART